ncbi:MAG: vWA domain-containing protein [Planctomycetota bacterium]
MRRPLRCLGWPLLAATLFLPVPVEGQVRGGGRERERPAREAEQEEETEDAPLSEAGTRAVLTYYERSEDWPVRVLALLRLGSHWHPVGAPIVAEALGEKDPRLKVYALEMLQRTRDDVLRSVATPDLIDALIKLSKGPRPFEKPIVRLIRRISGDDTLENRSDIKSWWRRAEKDGYEPAPWPEIPEQPDGEEGDRTSTGVLDQVLDLKEAGLDLAIVIDGTGSMGGPIAACTKAMDDLIVLLGELTSRFRVGVVVYRDFGDMSDGADVALPLRPRGREAQKELSRIVAGGGGDAPERVEKGFEFAISREMRWRPEANKLIVIIGDAPPHANTQEALVEAVKMARESAAAVISGGPTTGAAQELVRPFLTSCIAASPAASSPFREIAEAGGGTFAQLSAEDSDRAARQIASHVLRLSFGARWRRQAEEFARIYFDWRDKKVLR